MNIHKASSGLNTRIIKELIVLKSPIMSQWLRVQKGNLELDVLCHNREIQVTTTRLGVCSRSKDAILARSYEIMTQLIFSNTTLIGREKEAVEAFFMRNGFTILHTLHL